MKGIKGLISVLLTVEAKSDAVNLLTVKADIVNKEIDFQTKERLKEERKEVA